jgi:hypothetical protein
MLRCVLFHNAEDSIVQDATLSVLVSTHQLKSDAYVVRVVFNSSKLSIIAFHSSESNVSQACFELSISFQAYIAQTAKIVSEIIIHIFILLNISFIIKK